jgi:hypothetical protein
MLPSTTLAMNFPDSTAIARGAYRPRERTLDLWWRTHPDDRAGRLYSYFEVPSDLWRELLSAHSAGASVGEFANRRIKPFYRYEPAEPEPWR